MTGQRVAFLDRDGTINVDHHYVHRWDQWEFVPSAIDALQRLHAAGFQLAIVSNQSGIARGYFTAADVDLLHEQVRRHLAAQHVPLAGIVYCPHGAEDGCSCRKPQPGLAHQIETSLGDSVDYRQSWMIGDKQTDIEFGQALGMHTILLLSEYWSPADVSGAQPKFVASTLGEAARYITSR